MLKYLNMIIIISFDTYLFIYLSYDKPSQSKDMLSTLKVKNKYEGKK